jgi:predicted acetyltransferase
VVGGKTGTASPVGFALVRGVDAPTRVLSSFFVVRGARRSGVGRQLAAQVLAGFPGRWEIAFQDANEPAGHFWRAVATDAVGTTWAEERRPVPGRPDLPPDAWILFTTSP